MGIAQVMPEDWEDLVNLAPVLAAVTDLAGNVLSHNLAWEEILGLSPETILGGPIDRWVDSEDRSFVRESIGRAGRGVVVAPFECRLSGRSARSERVVATMRASRDRSRCLISFRETASQIPSIRQLQRSEELFRCATDQLPERHN